MNIYKILLKVDLLPLFPDCTKLITLISFFSRDGIVLQVSDINNRANVGSLEILLWANDCCNDAFSY